MKIQFISKKSVLLMVALSFFVSSCVTEIRTIATTTSAGVAVPLGFAYVANYGSNSISMYSIDKTTGILSALNPSTIATGTNPKSITVDPSGKFLYVANYGSNSISMYTINQSTGLLTPNTPATIANGNAPDSISVDPSGHYAYAANYFNISMYLINQTTGELTANTPFNVVNGDGIVGITFTPNGKIALGSGLGGDTVDTFTINGSGVLANDTHADIQYSNCNNTVIHPNGLFAYSAESGGMSEFLINSTTGGIVPNTSPNYILTGTNISSIKIEPSGSFLYTTNASASNILMYSINIGSGALSSIGNISTGVGSSPIDMSIESSGRFIYVTDSTTNSISMFSINLLTGALSPLSTAQVAAGTTPSSIVTIEIPNAN